MSEWVPRTRLGRLVQEGKINSLDQIFQMHGRVLEPEIVDRLLPNLEQEVIDVKLVQRQTDAGEKTRFKALVVVGNRDGYIGIGTGKSTQVVLAIEKAIRNAKLNIVPVVRGCGSWECACGEPHSLLVKSEGKYGSVRVQLLPAPRGLGLVAGESQKVVLALAGVKDCWTRSFGETRTSLSVVGAVYEALKRTAEAVLPSLWRTV
ncbi:small subunit ribosomal protein S5 [Candidatus Caldarchaeum subterraneum]|uniref:Small ribosomal subunit protein uS5 n=1 Tax=Caldiarchaeum subterraneum TaxID=311458 RepID=E6N5F4_CALS0|nr:small subunit ribosomal protein S5 [Candidatus Caldarchaeum subterraneum]BAJ49324.1 small subunit ribosomal protein S5 [Candidatus Caldarchaeum subterraneum]BAJ50339.1 small subunit ribosomal protein S5 [Candidatus Caldarchaeum subterraneum]